MLVKTITIESVDLELLHNQRRDLEKVMNLDGVTELQQDNLEGLLILLDYICDKYEVLTYSTDDNSTCNCDCGCEVPLDSGQCVDCGDETHQNNNNLDKEEGEEND